MTGRPVDRESGQAIVFFTVFLVVLLSFLALVIDGGMYLYERREMQGVADAAAMAAVRELPASSGQATSRATEYAQTQNADSSGSLRTISFSNANSEVRVEVGKSGNGSFGGLLGMSSPEISAFATARVQMAGPLPGMLPMAFMRDQFTVGQNYEIKFDGTSGGNRGAIAPKMGANCSGANGANDFRNLIRGSSHGGVDACATNLGSTIETEPGNMSGPTRQGFDDRVGSNSQTFSNVFTHDAATGTWAVNDPESPRIGIVPVIETTTGGTTWPSGRENVRIVSYMLVYIGKTDAAGNPPYTNNGKSAWVTPIRAVLPSEWTPSSFVDYNSTSPAPVAYRLID